MLAACHNALFNENVLFIYNRLQKPFVSMMGKISTPCLEFVFAINVFANWILVLVGLNASFFPNQHRQ